MKEGVKRCSRCRQYKPLSAYGPARNREDGVQNYCRICSREKVKEWRALNRDKVKKTRDEYERTHKEHLYQLRLERIKRLTREDPVFYEKAQMRKLVRKCFTDKGTRESRKLMRICGITPQGLYAHLCETWEQRYGYPYMSEPCHIDHIVPLAQAKTIEEVHQLFHWDNLQLLTPEDNRAKRITDFGWHDYS